MNSHPTEPSFADVLAARKHVYRYLQRTPLLAYAGLSERIGAKVYVKHENHHAVGAFKVRGGIFLASELSAEQLRFGLVTASTGNHAQSVAFAARLHDVPAVLFVPEGANPDKIASIERLGGEVRQQGARFDDARAAGEEFAAEHAMLFIDSANEPQLIAGVATAALEVLESQQPETDLVLVPVGAGSGVCGWLTVRDGLGHGAELWGVQSAQAPAARSPPSKAWRRTACCIRCSRRSSRSRRCSAATASRASSSQPSGC